MSKNSLKILIYIKNKRLNDINMNDHIFYLFMSIFSLISYNYSSVSLSFVKFANIFLLISKDFKQIRLIKNIYFFIGIFF